MKKVNDNKGVRPKLLYFVNVDWFFKSHRLPLALAAIKNGYEVHLVTSFTQEIEFFRKKGIITHNLNLNRSSTSVFAFLNTVLKFLSYVNDIKPNIIHLITIKPIIIGSLACLFSRKKFFLIYAFSGLGYVFIAKDKKSFFRKFFIILLYKISLIPRNKKVIFQNYDDFNEITKYIKIPISNCTFIKGSGVDLKLFKPSAEEKEQVIVLFAARLLTSKGIYDFINIAKNLNNYARFVVVGDFDQGNRDCIHPKDFYRFVNNKVIEYWGHSTQMHLVLNQSSIVVLPSVREGMPKILLEAAACGKPVVTYDVPGCRDAIIDNKTGFLVPLNNLSLLQKAIETLIKNKKLRDDFGKAGRILAVQQFDIDIVVRKHMEIYDEYNISKTRK